MSSSRVLRLGETFGDVTNVLYVLARLRPEPLRTLSAVIATPYWHAEELLSNGRGIFETAKLSPARVSRYSKTTNVETRCAKGPICLGVPWFGTKLYNVF
jgi:hypothetical protein